MHYNFWRGQKIRLRAIEQKDLDEIMTSTEEADSEIDRFISAVIEFPVSREQDRKNLEGLANQDRKDGSFFWIIEDLEGNRVGYSNTFDCEQRFGIFKYALAIFRPYWGRGYAQEAIQIILRYYFRELRYQKATVLVYSFNERSLRLHEKMGFKQEGRLRRMVYTNGEFHDEIYFGMTWEEFDQLYPI